MDPDTDDGQLVYQITTEPKHGFLESKIKPGNPITSFTQGTHPHTEMSLLFLTNGKNEIKRENQS